MKLDILLFGITTDLVGTSSLEIEVPTGSSIADLKKEIATNHHKLEHIHTYAIAVNESYATDETLLQEGDVVAIIPPVSGG